MTSSGKSSKKGSVWKIFRMIYCIPHEWLEAVEQRERDSVCLPDCGVGTWVALLTERRVLGQIPYWTDRGNVCLAAKTMKNIFIWIIFLNLFSSLI